MVKQQANATKKKYLLLSILALLVMGGTAGGIAAAVINGKRRNNPDPEPVVNKFKINFETHNCSATSDKAEYDAGDEVIIKIEPNDASYRLSGISNHDITNFNALPDSRTYSRKNDGTSELKFTIPARDVDVVCYAHTLSDDQVDFGIDSLYCTVSDTTTSNAQEASITNTYYIGEKVKLYVEGDDSKFFSDNDGISSKVNFDNYTFTPAADNKSATIEFTATNKNIQFLITANRNPHKLVVTNNNSDKYNVEYDSSSAFYKDDEPTIKVKVKNSEDETVSSQTNYLINNNVNVAEIVDTKTKADTINGAVTYTVKIKGIVEGDAQFEVPSGTDPTPIPWYTITPALETPNSGTITFSGISSKSSENKYHAGTPITATITPNTGFILSNSFDDYDISGTGLTSVASTYQVKNGVSEVSFVMPASDITFTAKLAATSKIKVNATNCVATIANDKEYSAGETVTINMVAGSDAKFTDDQGATDISFVGTTPTNINYTVTDAGKKATLTFDVVDPKMEVNCSATLNKHKIEVSNNEEDTHIKVSYNQNEEYTIGETAEIILTVDNAVAYSVPTGSYAITTPAMDGDGNHVAKYYSWDDISEKDSGKQVVKITLVVVAEIEGNQTVIINPASEKKQVSLHLDTQNVAVSDYYGGQATADGQKFYVGEIIRLKVIPNVDNAVMPAFETSDFKIIDKNNNPVQASYDTSLHLFKAYMTEDATLICKASILFNDGFTITTDLSHCRISSQSPNQNFYTSGTQVTFNFIAGETEAEQTEYFMPIDQVPVKVTGAQVISYRAYATYDVEQSIKGISTATLVIQVEADTTIKIEANEGSGPSADNDEGGWRKVTYEECTDWMNLMHWDEMADYDVVIKDSDAPTILSWNLLDSSDNTLRALTGEGPGGAGRASSLGNDLGTTLHNMGINNGSGLAKLDFVAGKPYGIEEVTQNDFQCIFDCYNYGLTNSSRGQQVADTFPPTEFAKKFNRSSYSKTHSCVLSKTQMQERGYGGEEVDTWEPIQYWVNDSQDMMQVIVYQSSDQLRNNGTVKNTYRYAHGIGIFIQAEFIDDCKTTAPGGDNEIVGFFSLNYIDTVAIKEK